MSSPTPSSSRSRVRASRAVSLDPRLVLLLILAVSAVARILYVAAYRNDVYHEVLLHDAKRYFEWGSSLAAGETFESGAYFQAPMYPWLLGLAFRLVRESQLLVYLIQVALGLTTIAVIHRLARRAYGDVASIAAAALAAFYLPFVFYETKLLPASLAVFLAALVAERLQALAASEGAIRPFVTGVVLGIAALTNPGFLLLLPAAAIWLAKSAARPSPRRQRAIALLAAGVFLVVAPVTMRNRSISGEWVLISANGGITFWQGNNPNASGAFSTPDGFTGSIFTQRDEARRLAETASGRPLGDGAASSYWLGRGVAFLIDDPLHAARLVVSKALLALASAEQPLEYNPQLDENPFRWAFPVPFALALALALAALRPLSRRKLGPNEIPLLIVLGGQLALMLAFFVSGRYRLPAMPALFAIAGGGLADLIDRVRRRSALPVLPVAGALAIFVVSLAIHPVIFDRLRNEQWAMGLCSRAGALRAEGYLLESEDLYRAAIRRTPGYPFAHLDLGKTLTKAGRLDEAETAIRDALRLAPGLAEAWFDLGVLMHSRQRLDEAEAAFGEAWSLAPDDRAAANNLLGTRLQLGRIAEARALRDVMRRRGIPADPPLDRWLADIDAAVR